MTKLRHKITMETPELNNLMPIIASHGAITENGFTVTGSARSGTYSVVDIESTMTGSEMRDLLEAHTTGDYEYTIHSPLYILGER